MLDEGSSESAGATEVESDNRVVTSKFLEEVEQMLADPGYAWAARTLECLKLSIIDRGVVTYKNACILDQIQEAADRGIDGTQERSGAGE